MSLSDAPTERLLDLALDRAGDAAVRRVRSHACRTIGRALADMCHRWSRGSPARGDVEHRVPLPAADSSTL